MSVIYNRVVNLVTPFLTGSFFLLLALLMCHSMIPLQQFATNCLYGDMVIFSYIASWGAHALFNCPTEYYNPPIFFPSKNMLPGTDGLELVSLLVSPIWHFTKNPVLTGNIALLMSHLFALTSSYFTTRRIFPLGRSASIVIAVLFAVSSDRLWHSTGHLNLVWSGILPLIFLAVWNTLDRPTYKSIIFLALALGLSIYFSVYFFVLGGITSIIGAVLWSLHSHKIPPKRTISYILLAIVSATIIATPKITIYKAASDRVISSRNSLGEAIKHSASIQGYLKPSNSQQSHYESYWSYVLPSDVTQMPSRGEDAQFLGFLLLILLIVEIARLFGSRNALTAWDRMSWASLFIAIFLVTASFGPNFGYYWENGNREPHSVSPYSLLYYPYLSFSGFFRVPARLAFVVQWIILIPIAVLFLNISNILSKAKQTLYSFLLIPIICFEHLPAQNVSQIIFTNIPAYDALERLDPTHKQPYVCVPPPRKLEAALVSCEFWRPTVNGWVASPLGLEYDLLHKQLNDFPSTPTIKWLSTNQIPWILVTTESSKQKALMEPQLHLKFSGDDVSLFQLSFKNNSM